MNCIRENLFTEENINYYKNYFDTAEPYRHLVIDNFLNDECAEEAYSQFPPVDKFNKEYKSYNEKKAEGSNFENFPSIFHSIRDDIMSKEFCDWLDKVTGIDNLYCTDDAQGRGLHQGTDGSFLDIHVDFNIHNRLDVHRRLNLLCYLNKDWQDEYGGHFELWDKEVKNCIEKIAPGFNKMVLFETSEISYHGYGKISVPEGVTRKSVYAYYYTDTREDGGGSGYHDTVFKARPEEGKMKGIVTNVKETMKNRIKQGLKKVGVKI